MNREPLWLCTAGDEPYPHPEDRRYAIDGGWIRRAPQQEPEQETP